MCILSPYPNPLLHPFPGFSLGFPSFPVAICRLLVFYLHHLSRFSLGFPPFLMAMSHLLRPPPNGALPLFYSISAI